MSEKTTNEILAEYMGLCWHDIGFLPIDPDAWTEAVCIKCREPLSGTYEQILAENPAYDSESSQRSLLSGLVAKVIAEFGEAEYGIALEREVNAFYITKGTYTHDEIVWLAHNASADQIARACAKLIEAEGDGDKTRG